jgi:hypothetical protein
MLLQLARSSGHTGQGAICCSHWFATLERQIKPQVVLCINASGGALNGAAAGFYVDPITINNKFW